MAAVFMAVLLLAGCSNAAGQLQLTMATGFRTGVYFKLGSALAREWSTQMGTNQLPRILQTNGSQDNVDRLRSGEADVAFSAADVATDDERAQRGARSPRALARIYDDYLHIAVRDEAPIHNVADLRGKRVSIGASGSGVEVIAKRVLDIAGLGTSQLTIEHQGLPESSQALLDNKIDAFFWSGGLPTDEIHQLADNLPLRLLDLADLMPRIRQAFAYYSTAAIPVSVYTLKNGVPVTTLIVPNLLLASDRMPADTAKALTQGIFEAQPKLALVSKAANSIDIRSAIETRPVPLHEGALQFYRDNKR
jgi:TRAP transporter TAXI family solute receptor